MTAAKKLKVVKKFKLVKRIEFDRKPSSLKMLELLGNCSLPPFLTDYRPAFTSFASTF